MTTNKRLKEFTPIGIVGKQSDPKTIWPREFYQELEKKSKEFEKIESDNDKLIEKEGKQ